MTRRATGPVTESGTAPWRVEAAVLVFVAGAIFLKLLYSARLIGIDGSERLIGRTALATVLCLIAPFVLLPRALRLPALLLADVAMSVAMIADELYFRRYL